MEIQEIKIIKNFNNVNYFPENYFLKKAYDEAAGYDLTAIIPHQIELKQFEIVKIPTGIALEMNSNLHAEVRSKSGLSSLGVFVVNSPGTIDSDYRGEIQVILGKLTKDSYFIQPNEKIAQIVFSPTLKTKIVLASELTETKRNKSGFGSSGKY